MQIRQNVPDGTVVLSEAGVVLPGPSDRAARQNVLSELCSQGVAFYLDVEDADQVRIALYVDEPPTDMPAYRFQSLGGSFLVALPNGQLAVNGSPALSVPTGDYAVRVLGTVVAELDAAAYEKDRRAALSTKDWRYRRLVERLSAVGCLALLLFVIVLLVYGFSWTSLAALAIGTVVLLPALLASRSRRWLETERRLKEYEQSFPQYLFLLSRIESRVGLSGGHLVV